MPRKVMVFDERIDSYNEYRYARRPFSTFCHYCYEYKELRIGIHNPAFLYPLYICDDCAMIYYGGLEISGPNGEVFEIPVDPLLEYLNEIDPIEGA